MRKKFTQLIVGGISLTLALTSIPNQVLATNLEDLSSGIEVNTDTNTEINIEADIEVDTEINTEADVEVDTEINTEADVEVDTEINTEADVEVDTEINTEVDAEVDTEVDTEINTEVNVETDIQTDENPILEYAVVLGSTSKQEFIKRLYQTCLGRTPSESEVDYWVGRIDTGESTGSSLADYFMNSEELKAQNLSNTAYIKVLYKAFFNREADEGGLEYWLVRMANGLSRGEALGLFIDSQEYTNICLEYGIQKGEIVQTDEAPEWYTPIQKFVYRFYKKCMDRTPDLDGLNYWALGLELEQFTGQDVAENFINSTEFINKSLNDSQYLDVMYSVFFDRPADQGGKSYWLSVMNPWNRNTVLNSFIHSNEFFDICASYGIIAIDEKADIKGFTRGTGTKENPYIITKPTQFALIEDNITRVNESTYFVLGQDISMQGIEFVPIGNNTAFKGQFDGRGYTISNLTINQSGSYGAMFAETSENSSICNINLAKVSVINLSNSNYTGALVGENAGKIVNCHASGLVKSSNYYTGGLVGVNKGEINNASFEGTCISNAVLGGLVGKNEGTINTSYAKSTNNGTNTVGGLIGDNYGTVMNSYAISDSTTGYYYAGGLIGYDYKGKVYNCFSAGSVNGYHKERGGLVGKSDYGYFENCYAATKLNGVTYLNSGYYNGLLIGYSNKSTLNICYGNSDTFTSWGYYEGDKINCKLLTTTQMKTDNFAQVLNNNIASTYWSKWTRNNNINEGLPYFMN